MRVVSYIRVSGRGQIDGDGPERQRLAVSQFVGTHGLSYIKEFFEGGVSGAVEAMSRPKFVEMIEFIESQPEKIDGIVVERLDRLARELLVSELLLTECRKRGLKVFAADQAEMIDLASNDVDPARKMIRQILGVVAEYQKSEIVYKLRVARMRARKKLLRVEGRKPYGYIRSEEIIKGLIFKLKAEAGLSLRKIAELLNDEGYKTREGRVWNVDNVYWVLTERGLAKNRKKK